MRQSKNLPTKLPVATPEKKEEEPVILEKIKVNWKLVTLLLLVAILSTIGISKYYSDIKINTEAGWTSLHKAWNYLQYQQSDMTFKVKDLGPDLAKEVQNTLGTVEFLPQMLAQNLSTKDISEVEVGRLPSPLQEQIVRQYHINNLLAVLPKAKDTEAGPWIYYTLCKLYYLNQQPKEALAYYSQLATEYPQHRLVLKLQELQEQNTLQNELTLLETQKGNLTTVELTGTKIAVFTTSRGKFTVLLWDQQFANHVAHLQKLVDSGMYQGINFYGINPNTISFGCPMGTGKGGQSAETNVEIASINLPYGTLAFEPQTINPNIIDSRLVLFKKHPFLDNRHYGWLGKVIEGMNVVESLTPNDVLLDVTISSK